jgi:hypothetical protein
VECAVSSNFVEKGHVENCSLCFSLMQNDLPSTWRLCEQFYLTLALIVITNEPIHVRWVPCHHSMVCPQGADGGTASSYGR